MGSRTTRLLATMIAALLTASGLAAAHPAVKGNPTRGKALFLRTGLFCGSCHVLKAAHSTGRSGPNLDRTKPSYATVVAAVSKGRKPTRRWPTGMPAYAGRNGAMGELTKARIDDLAAFVYTATHR